MYLAFWGRVEEKWRNAFRIEGRPEIGGDRDVGSRLDGRRPALRLKESLRKAGNMRGEGRPGTLGSFP